MSEIPGTPVSHSVISDVCRNDNGDEGAFLIAVRCAKMQYHSTLQNWTGIPGVKYHLTLSVERPETHKPHGSNQRSK